MQLIFDGGERALYILHILAQLVISQQRNNVGYGATAIAVTERKQFHRGRREVLDAEIIVKKNGRNLRAVEKVLKIIIHFIQLIILALQLTVDGLKLLINRLHFFLSSFKLLIRRL